MLISAFALRFFAPDLDSGGGVAELETMADILLATAKGGKRNPLRCSGWRRRIGVGIVRGSERTDT